MKYCIFIGYLASSLVVYLAATNKWGNGDVWITAHFNVIIGLCIFAVVTVLIRLEELREKQQAEFAAIHEKLDRDK